MLVWLGLNASQEANKDLSTVVCQAERDKAGRLLRQLKRKLDEYEVEIHELRADNIKLESKSMLFHMAIGLHCHVMSVCI